MPKSLQKSGLGQIIQASTLGHGHKESIRAKTSIGKDGKATMTNKDREEIKVLIIEEVGSEALKLPQLEKAAKLPFQFLIVRTLIF